MAFSCGQPEIDDMEILKQNIVERIEFAKSSKIGMKRIYYIAHLCSGVKIKTDAKNRKRMLVNLELQGTLICSGALSYHPSKIKCFSTEDYAEPKNSIFICQIQKITALS